MSEFLTVDQVAKLLDVSVRTIRRRVEEGSTQRSKPAETFSSAARSLSRENEGVPVRPAPPAEETGQATYQPPRPASLVQEIALLSTADVAELFGRTNRTIQRWISRRHLVPVRVGGAVFFRAEDVRRLVLGRISTAILQGRGAVNAVASDVKPSETVE
jgi:excisionase family DNA binding protein